MKMFAVYFDGEITVAELRAIYESAGYELRFVGTQIIARRVPSFLRHEAPATNVVKMPRAKVRGSAR